MSLPSENITLVRNSTSHEDSMMENQHGGMLISNEKATLLHASDKPRQAFIRTKHEEKQKI